jgi:hypothetical protein
MNSIVSDKKLKINNKPSIEICNTKYIDIANSKTNIDIQ